MMAARSKVIVLKDYQDRLAGIDPSKFIGSLLWFNIRGESETDGNFKPIKTTTTWLEAQFDELGLDKKFIPERILPVHVFRKVSSPVRRDYPGLEEGVTHTLFVEEVTFDNARVLRHIVKLTRDAKNESLDYNEHMATLRYFRGRRAGNVFAPGTAKLEETILDHVTHARDILAHQCATRDALAAQLADHVAEFNALPARKSEKRREGVERLTPLIEGETAALEELDARIEINTAEVDRREKAEALDVPHIKSMIAQIKAEYEDGCDNLQHATVRGVIRDYLGSLNAIAVKPQGGVYFVHNDHQDTIDSLETLVTRLGPNCEFHQLPLLDTPKQREMLTDKFQDEIIADALVLMKKLDESTKKGKITSANYGKLMEDYNATVARALEYSKLLDVAQGRAGAQLDICLEALTEASSLIA